jgi:hypothetical protein
MQRMGEYLISNLRNPKEICGLVESLDDFFT